MPSGTSDRLGDCARRRPRCLPASTRNGYLVAQVLRYTDRARRESNARTARTAFSSRCGLRGRCGAGVGFFTSSFTPRSSACRGAGPGGRFAMLQDIAPAPGLRPHSPPTGDRVLKLPLLSTRFERSATFQALPAQRYLPGTSSATRHGGKPPPPQPARSDWAAVGPRALCGPDPRTSRSPPEAAARLPAGLDTARSRRIAPLARRESPDAAPAPSWPGTRR